MLLDRAGRHENGSLAGRDRIGHHRRVAQLAAEVVERAGQLEQDTTVPGSIIAIVNPLRGNTYAQPIWPSGDRVDLGRRAWAATGFDLGGLPMLALAVDNQVVVLRPADLSVVTMIPMETMVFGVSPAGPGELLVRAGRTLQLIRLEP